MSPPVAATHFIAHEHPGLFAEFAGRLQRAVGFGRPDANAPGDNQALIERLLAYATSVERQVLEQKRRIAELEALSRTDELTGLANRRAFDEFLARTLALAERHGESGVLAYFDLDGFKEINDQYGHAAGDAALRHMADLLRASIRTSDFAARLHGDEFVVLLVRADCQQGRERAQSIADSLARSPLRFAGRIIPLRASTGVAVYNGPMCAEHLLAEADQAMYQHKKAARSRP